jgi:DNA-binding NarL/FixJ family response regulator
MIRALLVDGHALVRSGLGLILSAEHDVEVVGEAPDGPTGVAAARALRPDVVLMDVRPPVRDGIEATRRLVGGDGPGTDADGGHRVLAISATDDDELLWGVVEAGAAGVVLEDAPAPDLVSAVRVTARGGAWFDPRVAGRVLGAVRRHVGPPGGCDAAADAVATLTRREREVLRLLASGATNGEVAALLHLSERTVKGHVGAIFTKLGARDRAAAIIRAYDAGVVAPRRAAPWP